MQKELWKLAVSGMKKRKRNSLLLFGVLVIAFSFSIVGLSLVESMNVSNREYRYDNYGTWHTAVFQGKEGHTLPGVFVTEQAEKQMMEDAAEVSERELKEKELMYFFKTAGEQEETAEVIRSIEEELNGF